MSNIDSDQLLLELEKAKKQYAAIDAERKLEYKKTQSVIEMNKEQINKFKKENKDMKEMINALGNTNDGE